MYICIYIYIYYFMFNTLVFSFTGFGFWKYIQVIFYIGHYYNIILQLIWQLFQKIVAQTPHFALRSTQQYVAQKWLKYDVYYTKTRCVLQNNGRYYMFLLHKQEIFQYATESETPHAVYIVYLLSQYIALYQCYEYRQLEGW